MTPDEIRVAIRMLDQPVYYVGKYPVIYYEGNYRVRLPLAGGVHIPIFDESGDFYAPGKPGDWEFRGQNFSTTLKA